VWGIIFVFLELHPFFQIISSTWYDEFFFAVDVAMFGVLPSSYLEQFYSRPINEIVIFGYFSYYYIPLLIAVPLYLRRDRGAFYETTASLFIATLICLVLFLIFPAQGPRQYYGYLRAARLDGYLFTWIQSHLITVGGLAGGAFPSSHCAVAMASLVQAFRHRAQVRWVLLILVPLLSFATVYGWYHYAIDVFAGWVIGLLAVWISVRIESS
jgi:membrane-associated phospholipid phosphatase